MRKLEVNISKFTNRKYIIGLIIVLLILFLSCLGLSFINKSNVIKKAMTITELNAFAKYQSEEWDTNDYGWAYYDYISSKYTDDKKTIDELLIKGRIIDVSEDPFLTWIIEEDGVNCLVSFNGLEFNKNLHAKLKDFQVGDKVAMSGQPLTISYYVGNPKLFTYEIDSNNNKILQTNNHDVSVEFYFGKNIFVNNKKFKVYDY